MGFITSLFWIKGIIIELQPLSAYVYGKHYCYLQGIVLGPEYSPVGVAAYRGSDCEHLREEGSARLCSG